VGHVLYTVLTVLDSIPDNRPSLSIQPNAHSPTQVPKHISRDGDVRSDRVSGASLEHYPNRVRVTVERTPGHRCATGYRPGIGFLVDVIAEAGGEMTSDDGEVSKPMGVNVHSRCSGEQATRYYRRGAISEQVYRVSPVILESDVLYDSSRARVEEHSMLLLV